MKRGVIYVRFAWWFRWYVAGVYIMAMITGREPDWRKVDFWADKAIS